jgi:hypothetical protein
VGRGAGAERGKVETELGASGGRRAAEWQKEAAHVWRSVAELEARCEQRNGSSEAERRSEAALTCAME